MSICPVSQSSSITVLGIGEPFLESVASIDASPESLPIGNMHLVLQRSRIKHAWENVRTTGTETELCLGGSCVDVLQVLTTVLSGLGKQHCCSLLGIVEKDQKEGVHERLAQLGIQSLLVEKKNDNEMASYFVTPDKEKTMQTCSSAGLELSNSLIKPESFKNISHVHLEGHLVELEQALETSVQHARDNKATISLDLAPPDVVNRYRDRLKRCVQKVDIIFGNLHEMQVFTNTHAVEEIMTHFAHTQIVIVTNGSQEGYIKPSNSSQIVKFHPSPLPKTLKALAIFLLQDF